MNQQQFFGILDDYCALDPEQLSFPELLKALSDIVCRRCSLRRVVVHFAWLRRGESISGDQALWTVDSAVALRGPPEPTRLRDLRLLGRFPAVLGDQRPVTAQWLESAAEAAVGEGACAPPSSWLSVRLRQQSALAWFLLQMPVSTPPSSPPSWEESLSRLLHVVSHGGDASGVLAAHSQRRRFYQQLAIQKPRSIAEAQRILCELWRETHQADWVCMWSYNKIAQGYTLTAIAPDGQGCPATTHHVSEDNQGLAHYCCRANTSIYTEDLHDWRGHLEGREYCFVLAKEALEAGVHAVRCVPLTDVGEIPYGLQDALTLYFKEPASRARISDEALITMRSISAAFLREQVSKAENKIHDALLVLAQEHLLRYRTRPEIVLAEYCQDLVKEMQDKLRFRGVSVFLPSQFEDGLTCVASSGLLDRSGSTLSRDRFHEVLYRAGEDDVGQCFATGKTQILIGPPSQPSKTRELHEDGKGSLGDGRLLVPLIAGADGPQKVRGVIRCSGYSGLPSVSVAHFSPTDVHLAEYLARIAAPALQTLAVRVLREETIGYVRHDLMAPLAMIRDTIKAVIDPEVADFAPDRDLVIKSFDAYDIHVSSSLALGLVLQLGLDPTKMELRRKPTELEGQIVARLKNMLKYYARSLREIHLHFGDFREIPALLVDPDLIERVFQNLVVNAIKYGNRDTKVEITPRPAHVNEKFFLIDISNHGIGVRPEERERIFDPYYRSPDARACESGGAGLGLTISRAIMRKHDGDVAVTGLRDPTVFTLYFPKSLATSRKAKKGKA